MILIITHHWLSPSPLFEFSSKKPGFMTIFISAEMIALKSNN